jgi:hypothetical protein
MKFAVERVEQALNEAGEPDGHGEGQRWTPSYIVGGRWLDSSKGFNIREGEFVFVKGNFKKPPVEGTTEDFTVKTKKDDPSKSINFKYQWPDGNEAWVKVIGRSEQSRDMSRAGNAYNGAQNAQRAPQSHANTAQAAKPVPTMTQAVAVLRECVAAVEGWGSDAHATTLFLGRLRGDIRRDPSQAEIEAEKKRAEEAAAAAAAEAQRLADEAAARARAAAGPAGYEPSEVDDGGDIPF